jgi:hypothetical protein
MYCVDTCGTCCKSMCNSCTSRNGHFENCLSKQCETYKDHDKIMDDMRDEHVDRLEQEWWDCEFERLGI